MRSLARQDSCRFGENGGDKAATKIPSTVRYNIAAAGALFSMLLAFLQNISVGALNSDFWELLCGLCIFQYFARIWSSSQWDLFYSKCIMYYYDHPSLIVSLLPCSERGWNRGD